MSIVPGRTLRDEHTERDTRPQTRQSVTPVMRAIGPVVYAVLTPDGIKIGHTTNLPMRLLSLGVEVGDLLAFMRGTREDEQAIHEALAEHAVRGREWYAITDDVIDVVNGMRTDLGLDALGR